MSACPNRVPRRGAQTPAVAVAAAAPGGQLLFQAAMVATAWAGQHVLAINMPKMPELPKVGLPKIELPGFLPGGKKKAAGDAPAAKAKAPPKPVIRQTNIGNVKVRAASSSRATETAPTLAEVTGETKGAASIGSAAGWKRFPARRMPGANMDPWKKIASEISPKF